MFHSENLKCHLDVAFPLFCGKRHGLLQLNSSFLLGSDNIGAASEQAFFFFILLFCWYFYEIYITSPPPSIPGNVDLECVRIKKCFNNVKRTLTELKWLGTEENFKYASIFASQPK